MATFQSPLSFALAIALCVAGFSCIYAHNGGLTVELIHRDSPNSPFYNSQETRLQRLNNAFRRSISSVHHFMPTAASVSPYEAESEVIANRGEYLMSLSLGTPPFEILAIADTGSDLLWTQCKPCERCYKQVDPLFDPKSSKTYRDLSCDTSQCKKLEQTSCSSDQVCQYSYSYGDLSFTNGNVAVDTVTLASTNGRPVSFPKTVIGCGHQNDGTFDKKGSGIIGLGAGPVSLISQMGSSIGGKFSYCLVPLDSKSGNSSKLHFGSNAEVSGSGVQSTPLVRKDPDTFYFLTLEAISVGNSKIKLVGSSFGGSDGNIIIDSGTTLTLLPEEFFNKLTTAVEKAVVNGQPAKDPSKFLSLCYLATSDLKLPILTAHFSGADVKLQPINTFVQVSDDVVCFAFSSIDSGAIYGNIAQMNFLVGYDIKGKSVSFEPADCTKL
ncbi:unnamed protein product [Dovyalis caffra]|uniref:Peptidase A1 domain-containing protein n=1 Tax=Dovyalis caffra TaxID=77055 RepID=A0AAV1SU17_9ROSI|nr:unnamed protein product [Dovyalis caffra]